MHAHVHAFASRHRIFNVLCFEHIRGNLPQPGFGSRGVLNLCFKYSCVPRVCKQNKVNKVFNRAISCDVRVEKSMPQEQATG